MALRLMLAASLCLLALNGVAGAPRERTRTVRMKATCTGEGQLCDKVPKVSVKTRGVLRVEVLPSQGHCSDMIAHILVDGVERAMSVPIPPGGTSGVLELGPVSKKQHRIAVQAEGVLGGCNIGRLAGWQADVRITTN
jgi:hypothetical protein